MRVRRAALLALALLACCAGVVQASPGDLDSSFDGDGRKIFGYGGNDGGRAVAVQPDGKILVAGYGNPGPDMAITRLNPDGSFDSSFDGDGIVGADFGLQDAGFAMALQPNGKIVVAGATTVDDDVAVARFNPEGSLDTSFDGDGKKIFGYGGLDWGQAVAVQPDGKILVAGYGNPGPDMAITRLNADGSFDTSFDVDETSGDFGGQDLGFGMALQPNGRIVVVGRTSVGQDVAVARFNPDGSLDTSFDVDGKKVFGYGGFDVGQAVAIQPDGKLLIAGHGSTGSDMELTRLNPDGSFDTGFDGDGTFGADFGGSDEGNAIVLQPNGKIVVAGYSGSGNDVAVARFQPGGSLDSTFGVDGKRRIDFGGTDNGFGVALQPNGAIVVTGSTDVGADVVVARIEGDPPSGGGGGGGGGGSGGGGSGGGSGSPPRCLGKRATIVGTSRSERLSGTRRADVIAALGGNDRVSGLGANDRICGGAGNDRLSGGTGNDSLDGAEGNDTLEGQAGKDRLVGGAGRDRLSGGGGRDNCSGGAGNDRGSCEHEKSL